LATAQHLAAVLWPRAELLAGQTPGVVHVIAEAAIPQVPPLP
jgi:hypothetical protein